MPLHPAIPSPERILAFGDAGSWKTSHLLNIAKWAARTNSSAQFYIADSDFAIARMLPSYPEIIDRVHVYPCYEWTEYMTFQKLVQRQAKPTDWVCVDFISSAWSAVQNYFVDEVFKKDIGNYFLQARKELEKTSKNLSALEGWTDWSVINALYKQWVNPLLFRGQYHLYATAKSSQLSSDRRPTEDSNTRQLFLRHGVKPDGQKDLPYQFHTVILTGIDPRSNKRTITTIKDREREEQSGLVINNFAVDYLKGVAGWKMA